MYRYSFTTSRRRGEDTHERAEGGGLERKTFWQGVDKSVWVALNIGDENEQTGVCGVPVGQRS